MFEEIDRQKKELPSLKHVTTKVKGLEKLNLYQYVAIALWIVGIIGGVLLGNLFPACSETSGLFNACAKEEFNIGLMFMVWGIGFIFALCLYAIGHIISLLELIANKIK